MNRRRSRAVLLVAPITVALILLTPAVASAAPEPRVRGAAVETSVLRVPARDLGPCWAQAGRVVGGFFGSIGATIASPGWGAAAWAGYLGQMAQEKRTRSGNFAC
ncbi:hypothetical protein [Microbacterium sp. BLY]|uniref:hypothetical protein n=1 Tax=Microbacterium sp. BLY TaxID=2823280 RepID=UPI001B319912|nr:hypothetical protein [Microbacterium sp. BLY]MBP3978935.1 hypothetical protein [Microbacterium sp. BLY]